MQPSDIAVGPPGRAVPMGQNRGLPPPHKARPDAPFGVLAGLGIEQPPDQVLRRGRLRLEQFTHNPLTFLKGVFHSMRNAEPAQLQAEWAMLVTNFRASRLSQRRWEAAPGVTLSKLRYRVQRFRDPVTPTAGPAWVTVTPEAAPSTAVTVHVGAAEIRVAPGLDPALLQAVVRTLATC